MFYVVHSYFGLFICISGQSNTCKRLQPKFMLIQNEFGENPAMDRVGSSLRWFKAAPVIEGRHCKGHEFNVISGLADNNNLMYFFLLTYFFFTIIYFYF